MKNFVLTTAFCYVGYSKGMEELTGFGMKNRLTLPSLPDKCFTSLRYKNYEPIYSYKNENMTSFVRQDIVCKEADAEP